MKQTSFHSPANREGGIGTKPNLHLIELVEKAGFAIFRIDGQGNILYANEKMSKMFGFTSIPDFLTAASNISMLYENIKDTEQLLQSLDREGFINGPEVRFKRPDGQFLWIRVIACKIEEPSGQSFYEGFMVDITQQKNSRDSLNKSEKRFRMLVDQAADALFIHNFDGTIFDVNRQACESLGYSREELLNKKIFELDIEVNEKDHKGRYWMALRPGEYTMFEASHRHKNGNTFPVEVRLGRLDLEGQSYFLGLVRDITDRKKAENRLKTAYEEIKKLKNNLEEENVILKHEIKLRSKQEEIVGESRAIHRVLNSIYKVAKEKTCVLILGETGTGKELVAKAIHNLSPRKRHPLIKINSAAFPANLIEAELFGSERGAFTGAVTRQLGRFEAANRSTLFLDEIGDLPFELQAKLLRVLQDNCFERLGSSKTTKVDVRIIAATNHDLGALVREGKFRSDLYYRLNVFPIIVPPLRERQEDIPLLVKSIVDEYSQSMGKPINYIPIKTMELLQNYPWPGNVRELRNCIERAMIMTSGPTLKITPTHLRTNVAIHSESMLLEDLEKEHIQKVLKNVGWRISGTRGGAQILGLNESTLRSKMKKLGIKRPG
jgi:formate hydrogenlyase transcriptional activator